MRGQKIRTRRGAPRRVRMPAVWSRTEEPMTLETPCPSLAAPRGGGLARKRRLLDVERGAGRTALF